MRKSYVSSIFRDYHVGLSFTDSGILTRKITWLNYLRTLFYSCQTKGLLFRKYNFRLYRYRIRLNISSWRISSLYSTSGIFARTAFIVFLRLSRMKRWFQSWKVSVWPTICRRCSGYAATVRAWTLSFSARHLSWTQRHDRSFRHKGSDKRGRRESF